MKTHCKRGHEFTDKNIYRTRAGARQCRQCRTAIHADGSPVLRSRYGIDKAKLTQMTSEQTGICAISGMLPDEGTRLVIDHNHATKQVRQLLHNDINLAIGLFQENPDWLRKAADYLERWGSHEAAISHGVV